MRALVTGAAGFVGSHLVDRLLAEGHQVRGIDSFEPYYDPSRKRRNIEAATARADFELVEADLCSADLASLVDEVDWVFHLAAQPGVRASWDERFARYVESNVLATQRLLDACRRAQPPRVVYASSSSVYGEALRYPSAEDDLPRPRSPYGMTKLAGEHLCVVYAEEFGVPTVSLRYFSVYGPRQRPDMAVQRITEAAITGQAFPLMGDGRQVRDMTFVADVVEATYEAAASDVEPGSVLNVAGGCAVSLAELLDKVGALTGSPVTVERRAGQPGDVRRTGGCTERARGVLGWSPKTDLDEGLARQLDWVSQAQPLAG